MPYASSKQIYGGRQGLDERLAILIGLYIRKDSCIGSSFGHLVVMQLAVSHGTGWAHEGKDLGLRGSPDTGHSNH